MNNEIRCPYHFSAEQVDTIAATIGDSLYGEPVLQGVNDEIGIAKTRMILSEVQRLVSHVMGMHHDDMIILMLTDRECESLLELNLPSTIKDNLSYAIQ